jgi:hypothetical protein
MTLRACMLLVSLRPLIRPPSWTDRVTSLSLLFVLLQLLMPPFELELAYATLILSHLVQLPLLVHFLLPTSRPSPHIRLRKPTLWPLAHTSPPYDVRLLRTCVASTTPSTSTRPPFLVSFDHPISHILFLLDSVGASPGRRAMIGLHRDPRVRLLRPQR